MHRGFLALTVVASLVCNAQTSAAGHLVSREAAQERLAEAAARRAGDQAVMAALLSTPEAVAATESLGVDIGVARGAVATLGDVELADLAARAQALQADPAAGLVGNVNDLLVVFLIVAIVILVLRAVD